MKKYSLRGILKENNYLSSFYGVMDASYGKELGKKYYELKAKKRNFKEGLNIRELEEITELICLTLKEKNRFIIRKIQRDKSNLMQVYLRLFAFISEKKKTQKYERGF